MYTKKLEEDLTIFKTRSKDLQRAYNDSKSRLDRIYDEHNDDLERACDNAIQKGKKICTKEGLVVGSMVGAHRCRSYLLMTPHSQAFLDAIVCGLPEAYLHSSNFWVRRGTPMASWVGTIIEEMLNQIHQKERISKIDLDLILEIMERKAPTLENDSRVYENYPWYMECLKAAAQILFKLEKYAGDLLEWEKFSYHLLPAHAGMYGLLEEAFTAVYFFYPIVLSIATSSLNTFSLSNVFYHMRQVNEFSSFSLF